tara:strand:+ start:75 stop:428 length:354 start_codon:yes stop_codon:yes gene_type:complete
MKYLSFENFFKNLQSIYSLDKSPDFKSLFISLLILFFVLRFGAEIPLIGGIFLLMFLPYVFIVAYALSGIPLNIAKSKNLIEDKSQVLGWLIFGFLFFFIALIYVLIASKKDIDTSE